MKCLYKYPQAAYPYDELLATNGGAASATSSTSCSTPASSTNHDFDVEVEYAKADHDDLLMRVTVAQPRA